MYHRGEAELHGFPEKSLDLVVDSPFWPVIYSRHHFPETTESSTGASVDYQMQKDNDVLRSTPVGLRTFFFSMLKSARYVVLIRRSSTSTRSPLCNWVAVVLAASWHDGFEPAGTEAH